MSPADPQAPAPAEAATHYGMDNDDDRKPAGLRLVAWVLLGAAGIVLGAGTLCFVVLAVLTP